MTYSIAGSVVINSSGQIDWSRIINKPTNMITGTTTYREVTNGTGDIANINYRLEITGTLVRILKTNNLSNCANCNCNCSDGGGT